MGRFYREHGDVLQLCPTFEEFAYLDADYHSLVNPRGQPYCARPEKMPRKELRVCQLYKKRSRYN